MGFGPTDVFQEALTLGDRGEQQLNRWQAYASSILGQRSDEQWAPELAQ